MIIAFPSRCSRKVLKCLGEKNRNIIFFFFFLNRGDINTSSHPLFSHLLRAADVRRAPSLLTRKEELVTESTSGLFKQQLKEPIQELTPEAW